MTEISINWIWKPLNSVGPFNFGNPISEFEKDYKLELIEPADEITGWETYGLIHYETHIYVENSLIISINCYDQLIYQNLDILGMTLSEIRNLFGKENQPGELNGDQICIEYEELGLQLWFQDDIVTSASCYGLIED
ncbi:MULTISPECIES: hypothetical protein [Nostocales]|uniref:Uncharacterized protein n=2 Tax=Nostocales TaxID=1161 RepID=A0A0C1NCK2_9CYAN|nr:hypothetical protein [Tolypothrix bouteillei]KAF3886438.1 hypothetical protein DA73_0400013850 [Tolypothrix bouteillei VB521301]